MTLLTDRATPDLTWGEYLSRSCRLLDTQHDITLYTDANGFYIVFRGIVEVGYGNNHESAFAEFVQRKQIWGTLT
jgi:hypothetical protein